MKTPATVQAVILALTVTIIGYALPGVISIAKSVQETLPDDRPTIKDFSAKR
ncbi:hypothetical protein [Leptolyngbya sp. FACHB-17]|uniref:hypothetical protein n=1 Tax=unclassified Leptolyngbya TaxID=2650499 RepID=UPI0016818208|nr:hypothetical protein [Leptolyngbya sp. FACHB-17]MBD2079589.1 hypothetical protein [Leptolyngbya sp. FACHB-17]